MSILYPRLPDKVAEARFKEVRDQEPADLTAACSTSHLSQYYAATGGSHATTNDLIELQEGLRYLAREHGFPDEAVGRNINAFDNSAAKTLHATMNIVPAEAADRRIWAFLAVIVLSDVAVWRFPNPPSDRMLATDITRHVFGRLWWRAELLNDPSETVDQYHLLEVFPERNFDQILSRRRSIGGSPALVRTLAREWPRPWTGPNERGVLIDTLKHLMRRGAFQDLYGLPEERLRREIGALIHATRAAHAESEG